MKRIWKFDLPITDRVDVQLPRGARILSVDWQGADPRQLSLWALVDPDAEGEMRQLRVYGTGNPVPEDPGEHLGTVPANGFVWHVFEEPQA